MQIPPPASAASSVPGLVIRPMEERDVPAADHVMRLAFGTFVGMPDPASFMGDASLVIPRWKVAPEGALVAELNGEVVGSLFATLWGSVLIYGPFSLRPDLWGQAGISIRLAEVAEVLGNRWDPRHRGLFTFPQSPKHLGLYAKFGYWPRFLTCVMFTQVGRAKASQPWAVYSQLSQQDKESCLAACREMTGSVYEGLDLSREIAAVDRLKLGDTVLLWEGDRLVGLALCHFGPGTEAGSGVCYVKFGAVRPGPEAPQRFERLLDSCDAFARERGLERLVAGVNTARNEAFQAVMKRGWRMEMTGVVMQYRNEPGYNREGVYVLDDWR